jgi:hypothetical protein
MRRMKSVLAVAAATVAAMVAFASPAFAGTEDGSCINAPLSSFTAIQGPALFTALPLQLAVAVGIVVVAALALAPKPILRPPAPAGTTQAAS